jgi:3'-5' exoribonuclease
VVRAEACAYSLAYLDHNEPDIAMALRHIWTCASPGARYGQPAAMTLARYIRDADGQSAMADNQQRAFRTKSQWGFRRIGQNVFLAALATCRSISLMQSSAF